MVALLTPAFRAMSSEVTSLRDFLPNNSSAAFRIAASAATLRCRPRRFGVGVAGLTIFYGLHCVSKIMFEKAFDQGSGFFAFNLREILLTEPDVRGPDRFFHLPRI